VRNIPSKIKRWPHKACSRRLSLAALPSGSDCQQPKLEHLILAGAACRTRSVKYQHCWHGIAMLLAEGTPGCTRLMEPSNRLLTKHCLLQQLVRDPRTETLVLILLGGGMQSRPPMPRQATQLIAKKMIPPVERTAWRGVGDTNPQVKIAAIPAWGELGKR
jgi:hypothetical protein